MSEKRKKHSDEVRRSVIKRYLREGFNLSQIAKETGYSYAHVKLVAGQELEQQKK